MGTTDDCSATHWHTNQAGIFPCEAVAHWGAAIFSGKAPAALSQSPAHGRHAASGSGRRREPASAAAGGDPCG